MNALVSIAALFAACISLFTAIDIVALEIGRRKRWRKQTTITVAISCRTIATIGIIVWTSYGHS